MRADARPTKSSTGGGSRQAVVHNCGPCRCGCAWCGGGCGGGGGDSGSAATSDASTNRKRSASARKPGCGESLTVRFALANASAAWSSPSEANVERKPRRKARAAASKTVPAQATAQRAPALMKQPAICSEWHAFRTTTSKGKGPSPRKVPRSSARSSSLNACEWPAASSSINAGGTFGLCGSTTQCAVRQSTCTAEGLEASCDGDLHVLARASQISARVSVVAVRTLSDSTPAKPARISTSARTSRGATSSGEAYRYSKCKTASHPPEGASATSHTELFCRFVGGGEWACK
mmetsp:Transcript_121580/g.355303  ORF Transcript_121580/g.355303 Transcript_121580/m.355303 type:complete len:292 (+) Transcript_121580:876-1751(+)